MSYHVTTQKHVSCSDRLPFRLCRSLGLNTFAFQKLILHPRSGMVALTTTMPLLRSIFLILILYLSYISSRGSHKVEKNAGIVESTAQQKSSPPPLLEGMYHPLA